MNNVAISTVIVYLLVLPGILFQRAYSCGGIWFTGKDIVGMRRGASGHPSHPLSTRGFAEETLKSVLTACVLHFVFGSLLTGLTFLIIPQSEGWEYPLERILAGSSDSLTQSLFGAGRSIWTISYLGFLYAVSPLLGRIALGIVRKRKWDLKSKAFRFNDNWYYFFRGEIYDLKEYGGSTSVSVSLDHTLGTFVVGHGSTYFEYKGVIEDWTLSKQGELETIIITEATRKEFNTDLAPVEIEDHFLILEAKKIESIQLLYRVLERRPADLVSDGNAGA